MASGTRTITNIGIPAFDFQTERKGSFTVFSNDLNIDFRILVTPPPPGLLQLVHAGPILFATSALTGAGVRVQVIPLTIGSGFPPPPLSLVQVQTDTVRQVPTE